MKKIRDFLADDMFNHILMSGPDIVKYFDPAAGMTPEEKHAYCQGIFCTYPHIMLGNFTRWLFSEEPAPKDYSGFMEESLPTLQAKVFPVLEQVFAGTLDEEARGQLLIPVLTEVIPTHMLTGFHNYMFPDTKNVQELLDSLKPMLQGVVAHALKGCYDGTFDNKEKTEVYLFVATRMSYFILKRWHDWMFGAEVLEMGPPPGEGGPGGPPPMGPPPM